MNDVKPATDENLAEAIADRDWWQAVTPPQWQLTGWNDRQVGGFLRHGVLQYMHGDIASILHAQAAEIARLREAASAARDAMQAVSGTECDSDATAASMWNAAISLLDAALAGGDDA